MSVVEELASGENSFRHRFSWASTFAGAVVGTAVTLFLLLLGSGVGLSLLPVHSAASPAFLTLGGIYFLAAQALGFAVGGHIVGRLIGPMAETDREEEFRAAAHGLAVWGLCVTATIILSLLSSWGPAGSSLVAEELRLTRPSLAGPVSSSTSAYWTDVLFRPAPSPMHAALAWRRYAQANNAASDAPPADDESSSNPDNTGATARPMTPAPAGAVEGAAQAAPSTQTSAPEPPSAAPHVITIPTDGGEAAGLTSLSSSPASLNLSVGAAKAEVSRILDVRNDGSSALPPADRERVVQLVSQATGISAEDAARRVHNVEARVAADMVKRTETARKVARNGSLWMAFALLFGSLVAAMAAISARWEDDRITFGFRRGAERA